MLTVFSFFFSQLSSSEFVCWVPECKGIAWSDSINYVQQAGWLNQADSSWRASGLVVARCCRSVLILCFGALRILSMQLFLFMSTKLFIKLFNSTHINFKDVLSTAFWFILHLVPYKYKIAFLDAGKATSLDRKDRFVYFRTSWTVFCWDPKKGCRRLHATLCVAATLVCV